MAALRVRVFGKLHLQYGETLVSTFPTRRVEELLGYLLLHQGVQHPREKLVDTLWPDVALSNGRASLSTALWRLRKVIGQLGLPPDDILQSTRDWVAFTTPESTELDLLAFRQLLKQAESKKDILDSEREYRKAIEIYKGQFCEGLYAEWCLLAREQFERYYLRALGQIMFLHMHRREFEEAVVLGRDILNRDPLREEVHRALMRCFWKMGQRPRAVRQFQRCARLLQAELQILPMPETIHLFRHIVEDRLEAFYVEGLDAGPYNKELRLAFNNFLAAADELDALLEVAEKRQEEPVTV